MSDSKYDGKIYNYNEFKTQNSTSVCVLLSIVLANEIIMDLKDKKINNYDNSYTIPDEILHLYKDECKAKLDTILSDLNDGINQGIEIKQLETSDEFNKIVTRNGDTEYKTLNDLVFDNVSDSKTQPWIKSLIIVNSGVSLSKYNDIWIYIDTHSGDNNGQIAIGTKDFITNNFDEFYAIKHAKSIYNDADEEFKSDVGQFDITTFNLLNKTFSCTNYIDGDRKSDDDNSSNNTDDYGSSDADAVDNSSSGNNNGNVNSVNDSGNNAADAVDNSSSDDDDAVDDAINLESKYDNHGIEYKSRNLLHQKFKNRVKNASNINGVDSNIVPDYIINPTTVSDYKDFKRKVLGVNNDMYILNLEAATIKHNKGYSYSKINAIGTNVENSHKFFNIQDDDNKLYFIRKSKNGYKREITDEKRHDIDFYDEYVPKQIPATGDLFFPIFQWVANLPYFQNSCRFKLDNKSKIMTIQNIWIIVNWITPVTQDLAKELFEFDKISSSFTHPTLIFQILPILKELLSSQRENFLVLPFVRSVINNRIQIPNTTNLIYGVPADDFINTEKFVCLISPHQPFTIYKFKTVGGGGYQRSKVLLTFEDMMLNIVFKIDDILIRNVSILTEAYLRHWNSVEQRWPNKPTKMSDSFNYGGVERILPPGFDYKQFRTSFQIGTDILSKYQFLRKSSNSAAIDFKSDWNFHDYKTAAHKILHYLFTRDEYILRYGAFKPFTITLMKILSDDLPNIVFKKYKGDKHLQSLDCDNFKNYDKYQRSSLITQYIEQIAYEQGFEDKLDEKQILSTIINHLKETFNLSDKISQMIAVKGFKHEFFYFNLKYKAKAKPNTITSKELMTYLTTFDFSTKVTNLPQLFNYKLYFEEILTHPNNTYFLDIGEEIINIIKKFIKRGSIFEMCQGLHPTIDTRYGSVTCVKNDIVKNWMVDEIFDYNSTSNVVKEMVDITIQFLQRSFQTTSKREELKTNAIHLLRWIGMPHCVKFSQFALLDPKQQQRIFEKQWDKKCQIKYLFVELLLSSPSCFPFLANETIDNWINQKDKNQNNPFGNTKTTENLETFIVTLDKTIPGKINFISDSDESNNFKADGIPDEYFENAFEYKTVKGKRVFKFVSNAKHRMATVERLLRRFVWDTNKSVLKSNFQYYLQRWSSKSKHSIDKEHFKFLKQRVSDILGDNVRKFKDHAESFGVKATKMPKVIKTLSNKTNTRLNNALQTGLKFFISK